MPINPKNTKILMAQSGNKCAFPECDECVVNIDGGKEIIVGEMAHIRGENKGAARYNDNMTNDERNCPDNIVVLCRKHHKVVDDNRDKYTVDVLLEMKKKHGLWVCEQTRKALPNITFAELEVITKYLVANVPKDDNIEIISPKEKIRKNQLGGATENQIIAGLSRANLVRDYINQSIDSEFGERLKEGFIFEYKMLVSKENLKGDELFDTLLNFASNSSPDFKKKAAALAVLTYFFEKCDIFEK